LPDKKSIPRALVFALAALALTVLCRDAAQADPITLTITSNGASFIEGSRTETSTTVGGLTFASNAITFTSESGGPPIPITLGTFTLTNAAFDYTFMSFSRTVILAEPAFARLPNPAESFHPAASMTGSVGPGGGSIVFDFHRPGDPTSAPTLYTFIVGDISGSFVLDINDITLQTDGTGTVTAALTGVIRDVQFGPRPIPEPATLLLLGTGLSGVAAAFRRRRKS
jgi:hypothetical protein